MLFGCFKHYTLQDFSEEKFQDTTLETHGLTDFLYFCNSFKKKNTIKNNNPLFSVLSRHTVIEISVQNKLQQIP